MSFAPDQVSRLIADLFMKRISEPEFLSELGITKENAPGLAKELLDSAKAARDPEGVENGVFLMYRFGYDPSFVGILNALATEPWHKKHEDIVFALGKLKDPSSVPALAGSATATHPYLEDDEAFALGVKSVYALKSIQTPEAIRILGDLARSGNEVVADAAKGRLKDLSRNAATETARHLAGELAAGLG
jgi:hypothetical protein